MMGLLRQSPPAFPRYTNDRNVLQAFLSLAGEPGPDWAIRGGRTGVNFFTFNLISISFDY